MADSNLPMGAENDPRAPYNEVDMGTKECPECEGEGCWVWSDCGVDIKNTIDESDLCPKCGEHQGDVEEMREWCGECGGDGVVDRTHEDEENDYESYQENKADEQRENR